jgi:hypothetical protein
MKQALLSNGLLTTAILAALSAPAVAQVTYVNSFNARYGTVTLQNSDVTAVLLNQSLTLGTGAFTADGVTNTGSETVAGTLGVSGATTVSGTLTLGPGGSGAASLLQSGTGNFVVQLGGSSSILNFENSAGASLLQLAGPGGSNNTVTAETTFTALPYGTSGPEWGGPGGTGNLGSAGNVPIWENLSWTGTGGTTPIVLGAYFDISENVAQAASISPKPGIYAVLADLQATGSTTTGGLVSGEFETKIQNATGNTSTGGQYTGVTGRCNFAVADNGTSESAPLGT